MKFKYLGILLRKGYVSVLEKERPTGGHFGLKGESLCYKISRWGVLKHL